MKKKITAVMLVVLMGAMLFTGLTLAYFTDSDEAENVFTYGDVDIELIEDGWDESKAKAVFPGESYDKIPYVKNNGQSNAYVRIGVKVNGKALMDINGADVINEDDDMLLRELVNLNIDGWTFTDSTVDGEGDYTFWYNYKPGGSVLAAGAQTSALFTKVTIPADLTYEQVTANSDFTLTVIAQAVQTATFSSASDAFNAAF